MNASTELQNLESYRYPIGRFDPKVRIAPSERSPLIDRIAAAPAELRRAVHGLTEAQLEVPYRDGGWTSRQVVHHVADSHINAFIRFKKGLTEEQPRITTYDEKKWAELADVRETPIENSLDLLDAVHRRLVCVLRAMSDADFDRRIDHPEMGVVSLTTMLRLYAWHGHHHAAHISSLRARAGW